jgi:hypothetical protein
MERSTPRLLGLQTLVGGKTSAAPPLGLELLEPTDFTIRFVPKRPEFWGNAAKGKVLPGARVLPFEVFFAPRSARPVDTMLIVDIGGREVVFHVCGSIAGYAGRQWGMRRGRR